MTRANGIALKRYTYLISDLHLDVSRPKITVAFSQFLDEISKDAAALYILGDFVDAWIGDDDNAKKCLQLKNLLRNFADKGITVYFMHGNRDFLIGEAFAQEAGITLLAESSCITLAGQSVVLLHGDSLCTDDKRYQQFRQKVRNPEWQNKILRYPLFVRRLIAQYMRFRSRRANSHKAEDIMDVANTAVIEAFLHSGAKIMIHGHTHRPNRHKYTIEGNDHERIVLGDWDPHVWYVKASEDHIDLLHYPMG